MTASETEPDQDIAGNNSAAGAQHKSQNAPDPLGVHSWSIRHIGFREPGQTEIFSYDEGELCDGCLRIRTLYSGISTGTELTHFQGTNPAMHAWWDDDLKLFWEGGRTEYPFPFSGYMQVGRIESSRTSAYPVGQIVAMSYGHKSGHTMHPRFELIFPVPPEIDPILGIYVAQMGPICANGILHADEEVFGAATQRFGVGIAGRNVLVCGTGVIGLMTAMLCQRAGAAEVAIAGRNAWKLSIAEQLGLTPLNTNQIDVGVWCKERWHDGMGRRGAAFAFQCSGAGELLNHALRALEPQGTVVDLGFYQGGADAVSFGREFHHNGLRHICAQINRVPRKLAGSWNRARLAAETLAFLKEDGRRVRQHLITHILPFDDPQSAFDLLANEGDKTLQIVLKASEA